MIHRWGLLGLFVPAAVASAGGPSLSVDGNRLAVETASVRAVFDGPALVSVRPVDRELEFIHPTPAAAGVDLLYLNGNMLGQDKHQQVTVRRLSPMAARIVVEGADSHRSILITVDDSTGDIVVTPRGVSARRGVRAVVWRVPIHPEAEVTLPVVNGMRVRPHAAHPSAGRFPWPFKWEAQLAIAERDGASLMIHSQDRRMRFKALRLGRDGDRTELGFESEPTGPLWRNRTAGGIAWRINVYDGDWQVPARRYRGWMADACDLADKRRSRPAWVDDIGLAVCWAHANTAMLDALAEVYPPERTLIHLSHGWRNHKYDIQYPDYTPNEAARAYVKKADEMGFHVMPHFNYWALDMNHPFFDQVRDFQIRSVDQNKPEGWYWPPETYDYTRMAYIHPGFGVWREKLMDVVLETCDTLASDVAFIDQTLCTWNTDNGFVEGLSTVEGMDQLQQEFAAVRPELVLVGEGLNEVSFQYQCFAQAHIHDGWGSLERKHVEAAHPICAFLWAGHTRLIGYYHLRPHEDAYDLGIETYERMNALPTIITNNPEDLREMSAGTQRIFARAETQPAD